MIKSFDIKFFEKNGFLIIKSFMDIESCNLLSRELTKAIKINIKRYPKVFDQGMIHNCFLYGPNLRKLIENEAMRELTDNFLCKNAIIYAYQSSSLEPFSENFGSRIHVDSPRFIKNYKTNLGFILALDDFTSDNGATWAMPGSHKSDKLPNQRDFDRNAIQLTCRSGDVILFDARLVHKAGKNSTAYHRHALTINFCRPYMRSRFDFPKMLKHTKWVKQLNSSAKKYLGFDVRMPSSLEEFYLPESKRLYLPNQE